MPEAKLPDEFGLTETAATLPPGRARAFVEDLRGRLARCEDDDKGLGTQVEMIADRSSPSTTLTAWRVTVDVSDQRSVQFTMAILRRDSAVAQLTFVPAPRVAMAQPDFLALADRALERLVELPRRKRVSGGPAGRRRYRGCGRARGEESVVGCNPRAAPRRLHC